MNRRKLAVIAAVVAVVAIVLFISYTKTAKAQHYMFNPVGTWYGNAKPLVLPNPLTEVVMIPTFFADGNVIANDSHETTNPHTTAHGRWYATGPYSISATFMWMNLDSKASNGLGGFFKIYLNATAKVPNSDSLSGTLDVWFFPVGTDPLDPSNKGGFFGGTFGIEQLRRLNAQ
jgi:hypothetical protein